jgi:glycosyltransferase involved in cell wall biosynthesis
MVALQPKPKVIFLGPLPPPFIGPTLATKVILGSSLAQRYELIHLDTSDHRGIETFGRIDFWNLLLPLIHYSKLVWLLIRYRPVLVYIPISQTTLGYAKDSIFIIISKVFRRKVICHLRGGNFGNWFAGASAFTQRYVKAIHSSVDGQIVLGKKLVSMFEGLLPRNRLFVVPNGKDIKLDATRTDRPQRPLQVLFLSNLVKSKGVLDVLGAVSAVKARCPGVRFTFVGAWFEKETRERFFEYLEQNRNLPVEVKGTLSGNEKAKVLGESSVLVFPTYYPPEGHPWVLIEAMANSLPIVTTDHAAISESVIDGENGFLVAKRSPNEVADKLIRLLSDDELRKRMAARSRELYIDNFTEAKMVESLNYAFDQVVGAEIAGSVADA